MNPNRAPPITSMIGYGTDRRRASTLRPATATSSPAISSSAWPIAQVSVRRPRGALPGRPATPPSTAAAVAGRDARTWADGTAQGRRQRDRGRGRWRARRRAGPVLPRAGRFAAVGLLVRPGGGGSGIALDSPGPARDRRQRPAPAEPGRGLGGGWQAGSGRAASRHGSAAGRFGWRAVRGGVRGRARRPRQQPHAGLAARPARVADPGNGARGTAVAGAGRARSRVLRLVTGQLRRAGPPTAAAVLPHGRDLAARHRQACARAAGRARVLPHQLRRGVPPWELGSRPGPAGTDPALGL